MVLAGVSCFWVVTPLADVSEVGTEITNIFNVDFYSLSRPKVFFYLIDFVLITIVTEK
jgi:hypothetical protein